MGSGIIVILIYPFIVLISAILLAGFGVSLALFINNLKAGLKNKWPKKNIIGLIITLLINITMLIAIIILITSLISYFANGDVNNNSSSYSSLEESVSIINNFLLAHF